MSRDAPAAVRDLAEIAADLVDTRDLCSAIAAWTASPWRVVVLGPVGVGKSTLINAAIGEGRRPTGLGGVTEATTVERDGDIAWIDTPGLDGPHADAAAHSARDADEVVWIVDGLRPLTQSERAAMRAMIAPGTPLLLVISRGDLLDPAEHAEVVERVAHLAAPHAPVGITLRDLRADARNGARGVIAPTFARSPQRVRRVADALRRVEEALARLPAPPDRQAIAQTLSAQWRDLVRACLRDVEERVAHGAVRDRSDAARAFVARAEARLPAFVEDALRLTAPLQLDDAPELPPPPVATLPARDLPGRLGGQGAARRSARAIAAGWLADGEATLGAWLASEHVTAPAAARRRAVVDALAAAYETLHLPSPP